MEWSVFPPSELGGSSVRVFAIADAGDFDEVIAKIAEHHAVLLGRIDGLKALDVALLGIEESG